MYLIDEETHIVGVVSIRKRPPYNYGDLADLLQKWLDS